MHVNANRPEFFSEFDREDFLKNVLTTNANAVMLYLHSHYGYAYCRLKSVKFTSVCSAKNGIFSILPISSTRKT